MYYMPSIHIDMEYLEDENVVCLIDGSPWDDKMIELHNDVMMEKIIYALEYAFSKQHIKQIGNIKITPTVRIIFAHEPVADTYELLNRSKTIFENGHYVLEWEYRPSETDDDTNIPDDQ